MERHAQLADLHLVAKYYGPCTHSNFSYPRVNPTPSQPEGHRSRSSVGSDCSAPGMVDDQGSEVSVGDNYQYNATAAEIWDSFWPAQGDESQQTPKYPALVDSPVHAQFRDSQVNATIPEEEEIPLPPTTRSSSPSWPLPDSSTSSQTALERPKTPKATYSLYPRPTNTTKKAIGQPRTLGGPPPCEQSSGKLSVPTAAQTLCQRGSKPSPLHLLPSATTTTPTSKSAPSSPALPTDVTPKRPSASRAPASSPNNIPTQSNINVLDRSFPRPGPPPLPPYAPSRPRPRARTTASSPVTVPSLRTITSSDPSPLLAMTLTAPREEDEEEKKKKDEPQEEGATSTAQGQGQASTVSVSISVFEHDDEPRSGGGLASRIVHSITHKRAASESRRCARGGDFAREQLARVRAASSANHHHHTENHAHQQQHDDGPWHVLARQRSEYFGRILRRSR